MSLNQEYQLSASEIKSLLQSKQDSLDGKTTARDWEEIEGELNEKYDQPSNSLK